MRIWHCHCCGMGHCCGLSLIPSLGTSTCYRHSKERERERERTLLADDKKRALQAEENISKGLAGRNKRAENKEKPHRP